MRVHVRRLLIPVLLALTTSGCGAQVGVALFVAAHSAPTGLVPPAGFASQTAQAPLTGTWHVAGTTTASAGYADDPPGSTLQRVWTITRTCAPRCTYTLVRPFASGFGAASIVRATLVHRSDGWHATWPAMREACGGTATDPTYWTQHEIWVLRFIDGGTIAQANESSFSSAPACGEGSSVVVWSGRLEDRSTATDNGAAPAPATPPVTSTTEAAGPGV